MNIKNKESLYDWCINNNKKDIVDRWDYTLNKKSPKEIGALILIINFGLNVKII